ncbi:DUF7510 family protein [Haloarcula laminariae]|uniref:DUF7510 family protein n=1 Tax=Haloarcula laminariae TaxID=2961577 RepID=UPI0021C674CD|nr:MULTISPECIES: hypothetical protein [Halomicroarcula]
MSESSGTDDTTLDSVGFDMDIGNGRTEIRVTGDRDTAVIVRSESGEKIYLPPEDFDREPDGSAYDSPYEPRSGAQESPYSTHPDASSVTGMEPTAGGYFIVHPEPVTDVRFLR